MIEYAAADGVGQKFGTLLRRFRMETRLTQRMLADLSTVSERAIRDLELDRARPRTDTVRLIAEALRLGQRARAILEQAANEGRVSTPNLSTVAAGPPAALDAMIGRDAEQAVVAGELAAGTGRLVVLRGLPGVGKTRLAVGVADTLHTGSRMPVLWLTRSGAQTAGRPVEGAWLARLLESAARVLDGSTSDIAELADAVADHDALLVSDDGLPDADAVLSLLEQCPRLRVLVTTTDVATLPGERSFLVSPLMVPDATPDARALAAVPAAQLFLTHLDRIRPGHRLTSADVLAVAEICAAVHGIPAALVAAASWLVVYDLQTLAKLLRTDPSALLDRAFLTRLEAHVAALPVAEQAALAALAPLGPDFSLPDLAASTGRDVAETGLLLRDMVLHGVIRPRQTAIEPRFQVLTLTGSRPRT